MKSILLHTVPVIVLSLAAIFGLTAAEQDIAVQALTAIIGGVFAVVPIFIHHKK